MQDRELNFTYGSVKFGGLANQYLFKPKDYKKAVLKANDRLLKESCTICLRLRFIVEPIFFGILGCQFIPDDLDELRIQVAYSHLRAEEKESGTGLPDDLAEVVLSNSISYLSQSNLLGSGMLTFDRAYYHIVDSTPRIFRVLTRALINMIESQNDAITEDEVSELTRNLWKNLK